MPVAIATWLWPALAAILALAGLALLARAIFADRARNRRRCPHCWYDLTALPATLTCPECGRTARSERALRRTRRRWRTALAAMLLIVVAPVVARVPMIAQRGWPAAVPGTVLVLITPWLDSPDLQPRWRTPAKTIPQHLYQEFSSRASGGEFWVWQCTLFAELCLAFDRGLSEDDSPVSLSLQLAHSHLSPRVIRRLDKAARVELVTRTHWPQGVPIRAKPRIHRWSRPDSTRAIIHDASGRSHTTRTLYGSSVFVNVRWSEWSDDTIPLPPPAPDGLISLEAEIQRSDTFRNNWRPLARHPIALHVQPVPSATDIITPIPNPEAAASLAKTGPCTRDTKDGVPYLIYSPPNDLLIDHRIYTLAVRITLLLGGTPAYTAEAWWSPGNFLLLPGGDHIQLHPLTRDPIPLTTPGVWTAVFTSDPTVALRNFDATNCWQGQFELPVLLPEERLPPLQRTHQSPGPYLNDPTTYPH